MAQEKETSVTNVTSMALDAAREAVPDTAGDLVRGLRRHVVSRSVQEELDWAEVYLRRALQCVATARQMASAEQTGASPAHHVSQPG